MGAIFSAALSWIFQTVVLKFAAFTILYLIVSTFISYLVTKLSAYGPTELLNSVSSFTPGMWYFMDITMFTQFFPAMISAYVLRFAIRRMPVIG